MTAAEGVNLDLLSERQERIWRYVARFVDRHGYAPSIREIMHVEHTSTSVVKYNLDRLAELGVLRRAPGLARSIVLIEWPEVM